MSLAQPFLFEVAIHQVGLASVRGRRQDTPFIPCVRAYERRAFTGIIYLCRLCPFASTEY